MQRTVKAVVGSAKKAFRAFRQDQMGSIAQMTALSIIPMFFATGAAIDTVRITREQASFHSAIDSACLAVAADDRSALGTMSGSALEARKAELKAYAQTYLNQNYKPEDGAAAIVDVNLTITGAAITLDATHDFPMTIMKLANIDQTTLRAHCTVNKAMRPVELALVMDTTGSMASSGKIDGAKAAARALLDTLYGGNVSTVPSSPYIRVSLVPFAAGVRLDKNAYDFDLGWIDTAGVNSLSHLNFNDGTWNNYTSWGKLKTSASAYMSWNGCVEARKRGSAATNDDYSENDAAPSSGSPDTLFPAYFAADTPGSSYGYSYISTSGTPNENTGLTTTQINDNSNAGLLYKQKNQAKYLNKQISAESTSTTGPWSGCAATPVVPMTYNRSHIDDGIGNMTALGPTLIAEGLAWGWRSISPGAPFTQVEGSGSIAPAVISNYNDVRWRKVMVLMTDGDNDLNAGSYGFNNTIYSAYGRGGEALANNRFGTTSAASIMTNLDDAMVRVCNKIKAQNIELYVTSFGTGVSASTQSRLQSCATKPANYQHNTSSADLQAFFNHIGEDVLNKSIYVSQ
jgi:Flp pilus assembly protein TadG